jgi:hypothetical protein
METAANSSALQDASPYSVIARGYDFIMAHVDYEQWAIAAFDPHNGFVTGLHCDDVPTLTRGQPKIARLRL